MDQGMVRLAEHRAQGTLRHRDPGSSAGSSTFQLPPPQLTACLGAKALKVTQLAALRGRRGPLFLHWGTRNAAASGPLVACLPDVRPPERGGGREEGRHQNQHHRQESPFPTLRRCSGASAREGTLRALTSLPHLSRTLRALRRGPGATAREAQQRAARHACCPSGRNKRGEGHYFRSFRVCSCVGAQEARQ
eukprot:351898-Chlamydomonas_euryale.AAC.3